jgi:hypothetical protein
MPTRHKNNEQNIMTLLEKAKVLAKQYYELTGRPLGVTAEVAEYEAAKILGLELAVVRQEGFDATRIDGGKKTRLQIKGRCIIESGKRGQRISKIDLTKKWDRVILVLLDNNYNAYAIYEGTRTKIKNALTAPGSKARNERGQLGVAKFKSIGKKLWP